MEPSVPGSSYAERLQKLKKDLLEQVCLIKERSVERSAEQGCPEETATEVVDALDHYRRCSIGSTAAQAEELAQRLEQSLQEFSQASSDFPSVGNVRDYEEFNGLMAIFRKCQIYFDELSELLRDLRLPAATVEVLKGGLDNNLMELQSRFDALTLEEEKRQNSVAAPLSDPDHGARCSSDLQHDTVPEDCFEPLSAIRETLGLKRLKYIGNQLLETEWTAVEDTASSEPLRIVLRCRTKPKPNLEAVEVYEGGESRPDVLAKVKAVGFTNFIQQRAHGRA